MIWSWLWRMLITKIHSWSTEVCPQNLSQMTWNKTRLDTTSTGHLRTPRLWCSEMQDAGGESWDRIKCIRGTVEIMWGRFDTGITGPRLNCSSSHPLSNGFSTRAQHLLCISAILLTNHTPVFRSRDLYWPIRSRELSLVPICVLVVSIPDPTLLGMRVCAKWSVQTPVCHACCQTVTKHLNTLIFSPRKIGSSSSKL